jgi:hypothetical protein
LSKPNPHRLELSPRKFKARSIRLLPAFDTYLLGYRGRDLAVEKPLQLRLQRGGGRLDPAIVSDGWAIGSWSLRKSASKAEVAADVMEKVTVAMASGIEAEVGDIGRFLGVPTELKLKHPVAGPRT